MSGHYDRRQTDSLKTFYEYGKNDAIITPRCSFWQGHVIIKDTEAGDRIIIYMLWSYLTDLAIVIPEDVLRPLEGAHHTGDVDQGPGPRPEVDVGRPQDGGDAPRPQHLGRSLGPPRGKGRGQGGDRWSDNQTHNSHLKWEIKVFEASPLKHAICRKPTFTGFVFIWHS